jgi:hypothetical protein
MTEVCGGWFQEREALLASQPSAEQEETIWLF